MRYIRVDLHQTNFVVSCSGGHFDARRSPVFFSSDAIPLFKRL